MPNGKLRIIFRGLCVFITKRNGGGVETGKRVVLLDARKPEDLYNLYGINTYTPTNPLLPHVPVLTIPKAILESYTPNTAPNKPNKFIADEDHVFPLYKQILEITDRSNNPLPPNYQVREEFQTLIPDLKTLNNMSSDPAIITESSLDSRVIALVKIDKGILGVPSTSNPDPRRGTEQIRTKFKNSAPAEFATKVLANSVFWKLEVPPSGTGANITYPFRLKLKYPGVVANDITLNLKLKLKDDDPTKPIPAHIIISNMPTINDISINKDFRNDSDIDFALAYKIFASGNHPTASNLYLPTTIQDPDVDDEFQTIPPLVCNIARYD